MIVGGYALDLYCDDPRHDRDFRIRRGQIEFIDAQFTGQTYAQCARQARAKGWRFSRDQKKCICPVHSGKRKAEEKIAEIALDRPGDPA